MLGGAWLEMCLIWMCFCDCCRCAGVRGPAAAPRPAARWWRVMAAEDRTLRPRGRACPRSTAAWHRCGRPWSAPSTNMWILPCGPRPLRHLRPRRRCPPSRTLGRAATATSHWWRCPWRLPPGRLQVSCAASVTGVGARRVARRGRCRRSCAAALVTARLLPCWTTRPACAYPRHALTTARTRRMARDPAGRVSSYRRFSAHACSVICPARDCLGSARPVTGSTRRPAAAVPKFIHHNNQRRQPRWRNDCSTAPNDPGSFPPKPMDLFFTVWLCLPCLPVTDGGWLRVSTESVWLVPKFTGLGSL